MTSRDIEFIASAAEAGRIVFSDAAEWFDGDVPAQRALQRLEADGLVFPIARGEYALPGPGALAQVLPIRPPKARLAAWLGAWLEKSAASGSLTNDLVWSSARFVGLAIDLHTNLVWNGPELLVPLAPDRTHLRGLHHRVSVFAFDPADEPIASDPPRGSRYLLPSEREVVRVLAVHNDPRIREAARELAGELEDVGDLQVLLARTDPPTPFPDPKASLTRGPPFRYRLFAPQSWVKRNLEFSKPEPSELGVG